MKKIDGINFLKEKNYALCHICEFTDEIKEILKSQLSFICHGRSASESEYDSYTYRQTLLELVTRLESKNKKLKLGMIGELLSHLIIGQLLNEFDISSPYFNKESRQIKLGFDIILFRKEDQSLWITEVKSGEIHKNKDSKQTTYELLGTAKRGLKDSLNRDNSRSLWYNAINDAKISYENHKDLKDVIVELLDKRSCRCNDKSFEESKNDNVFLVSVLFAPIDESVKEIDINKISKQFIKEKTFNNIFLMSIQKQSYFKIREYLIQECKK